MDPGELARQVSRDLEPLIGSALDSLASDTGKAAGTALARGLWSQLKAHLPWNLPRTEPGDISLEELRELLVELFEADAGARERVAVVYESSQQSVRQQGRQNVAFLGDVSDSAIDIEG